MAISKYAFDRMNPQKMKVGGTPATAYETLVRSLMPQERTISEYQQTAEEELSPFLGSRAADRDNNQSQILFSAAKNFFDYGSTGEFGPAAGNFIGDVGAISKAATDAEKQRKLAIGTRSLASRDKDIDARRKIELAIAQRKDSGKPFTASYGGKNYYHPTVDGVRAQLRADGVTETEIPKIGIYNMSVRPSGESADTEKFRVKLENINQGVDGNIIFGKTVKEVQEQARDIYGLTSSEIAKLDPKKIATQSTGASAGKELYAVGAGKEIYFGDNSADIRAQMEAAGEKEDFINQSPLYTITGKPAGSIVDQGQGKELISVDSEGNVTRESFATTIAAEAKAVALNNKGTGIQTRLVDIGSKVDLKPVIVTNLDDFTQTTFPDVLFVPESQQFSQNFKISPVEDYSDINVSKLILNKSKGTDVTAPTVLKALDKVVGGDVETGEVRGQVGQPKYKRSAFGKRLPEIKKALANGDNLGGLDNVPEIAGWLYQHDIKNYYKLLENNGIKQEDDPYRQNPARLAKTIRLLDEENPFGKFDYDPNEPTLAQGQLRNTLEVLGGSALVNRAAASITSILSADALRDDEQTSQVEFDKFSEIFNSELKGAAKRVVGISEGTRYTKIVNDMVEVLALPSNGFFRGESEYIEQVGQIEKSFKNYLDAQIKQYNYAFNNPTSKGSAEKMANIETVLLETTPIYATLRTLYDTAKNAKDKENANPNNVQIIRDYINETKLSQMAVDGRSGVSKTASDLYNYLSK
tara:strand:- start:3639 stop:5900 length:2262 start_codon:yes stop_codon:yes gene_type:complete